MKFANESWEITKSGGPGFIPRGPRKAQVEVELRFATPADEAMTAEVHGLLKAGNRPYTYLHQQPRDGRIYQVGVLRVYDEDQARCLAQYVVRICRRWDPRSGEAELLAFKVYGKK